MQPNWLSHNAGSFVVECAVTVVEERSVVGNEGSRLRGPRPRRPCGSTSGPAHRECVVREFDVPRCRLSTSRRGPRLLNTSQHPRSGRPTHRRGLLCGLQWSPTVSRNEPNSLSSAGPRTPARHHQMAAQWLRAGEGLRRDRPAHGQEALAPADRRGEVDSPGDRARGGEGSDAPAQPGRRAPQPAYRSTEGEDLCDEHTARRK